MDFSSICRTCLGTKYLSPIFKDYDHDSFSTTVFSITGLKVEIDDGLPQQICKGCMKYLKDALKFRQLCKDAEIQLLTIKHSQGNNENSLRDVRERKLKPNQRRKKAKDRSVPTFINIKIEDFEKEDDLPLLQRKLNFTTVTECKNVKTETEFEKINNKRKTDEVKNEEVYDNINGKRKVKNELEIEPELVSKRIIDNTQKISNQYATHDKTNEKETTIANEFKYNAETNSEIFETETNITNELKYETEFLDLHFESDTDENLTKDMEITDYNMDMPKFNMESPKYNIRIANETEIAEYNIEIPDYNLKVPNMETVNQNTEYQIYFTKVKKRIKDLDAKEIQNPQKDAECTMNNMQEISQTDMPFLIQGTNRVICKLCQKNLSRRSIDSHMAKSHPGADGRKVKCDLCDTYVLKDRLKRHKVTMHGQDCFRCGYCKMEFDTKEALLDHVSTCTAKKRKRKEVTNKRKECIVECDVCNKSMQKASLRLHKEIKHAGMGPVCEHCGRRFSNKFRLGEHLRAMHGYEKYKCSMCDFLSASAMAIRNHERRHRGEKPYACERCEAKFHAPHLLAQHRQSHRTEKNMKCDQCPAAFKANNTLHMHKITCHNTNTYQCPMCPRTYSARHYAVKHLRAVHRHTGAVGPILVGPKVPHARDLKSPTCA